MGTILWRAIDEIWGVVIEVHEKRGWGRDEVHIHTINGVQEHFGQY